MSVKHLREEQIFMHTDTWIKGRSQGGRMQDAPVYAHGHREFGC